VFGYKVPDNLNATTNFSSTLNDSV